MERFFCGAPRLGLLVVMALGCVLAAPARAGTIDASRLAKRLALHQTITASPGTVVKGTLDLQSIGTVRAAFECRRCTFKGGIRARHVIFTREIDLGGVEIRGPLDLTSATFAAPVQLGTDSHPSRILGATDLTGATFADLADARRVVFEGPVTFEFTRFRGDAVFTGTSFRGAADFGAASFDRRADFSGALFGAGLNFSGALFGAGVDFGSATFAGRTPSLFSAADFRGPAIFSHALFAGAVSFEKARFNNDATFVEATFAANTDPGADQALEISQAVAQGTLDFEAAVFGKSVRADSIVARGLDLDGVTFTDGARISLGEETVGNLRFALDDLDRLFEKAQEHDVLAAIERSAKEGGDISLANDAHYRLQELRAEQYGMLARAADAVFYRGIAGYFVRPLRPLALLALLALTLALARRLRAGGVEIWGPRRAWDWIVALGVEIFDTFALAIPRAGSGGQGSVQLGVGRRLEVLVYRLLFVCALIGLANSNPTLRQMFDTLT